MNNAVWIWYPGDLELYHGMRQNFTREERGLGWPAFWKMDDWRKNIRFFRVYTLSEPTSFSVHAYGIGHVVVDGHKFPLEAKIPVAAGRHLIEVFVGNMTGLPCIYVEEERDAGESEDHSTTSRVEQLRSGVSRVERINNDVTCEERICSDASWGADDFMKALPVGTSCLYTKKEQNPNEPDYLKETVQPVSVTEKDGGVLVDFGRMVDGRPVITARSPKGRQTSAGKGEGDRKTDEADISERSFNVLYGESAEEALDAEWCYYKEENTAFGVVLRKRAFRFLFLPGIEPWEANIYAIHQRIPHEMRASFSSDNERIDRIWKVAATTYELCSGMFFIDGIKRDRWVWSGDAYQSYAVNPYLYFDREINKRTSRALRGNTQITQHINTIVDYSMLWLISIENEYWMDGDLRYVREMFPKMEAMMELLFSQTEEHGFLYGRERDWIYIDWAEIDKEDCISAEQILLWKCCRVMAYCAQLLAGESGEAVRIAIRGDAGNTLPKPQLGPDGRPLPADHVRSLDDPLSAQEKAELLQHVVFYEERAEALKVAILKYYWDEEKKAFIDSFSSGRRNVTRHANIFAVLFDFVEKPRQEEILRSVLLSDSVPEITTPYFKFFELDALGKLGQQDRIWETLHSYWGGMLDRGAVTFWETFDPKEEGRAQYGMYGDPFGKSLCHAWGASPIYLLGRYFLGVRPTSPGYETYEVKPQIQYFDRLDCVVPVGEKSVHIVLRDQELRVTEKQ